MGLFSGYVTSWVNVSDAPRLSTGGHLLHSALGRTESLAISETPIKAYRETQEAGVVSRTISCLALWRSDLNRYTTVKMTFVVLCYGASIRNQTAHMDRQRRWRRQSLLLQR